MIQPKEWTPADGLTLEPNALRAATEQNKCLALTAGPGAGKTEMLAQRADFLLRCNICRYPRRILAISFKVDASQNLKQRVRTRCGNRLADRFDSYTFHAFAKRIIDRFRPVLTGACALEVGYSIGDIRVTGKQITFNELVPFAIQILNTSKVARNAIRQTYSDVFLDEFQDCTDQQYTLLTHAFKGSSARLTAVGDTKQKIMAWAGALDGIFSTFVADFAAQPLNMYRNFRSQPRLLRMQNDIISVLDPASRMPANQVHGEEGEIHVWNYETSAEEAIDLADSIQQWINKDGLSPSSIAVLVSKQPDLYTDLLMNELFTRDIPCRNEQQLQDLSVEPIARLIIDYLSCIYGEREPAAWIRLMAILAPFEDAQVQLNIHKFIKAERQRAKLLDAIDNSFAHRWKLVKSLLNKLGLGSLTALSPEYESLARLKEIVNETKSRIAELQKNEPDLIEALNRFSDDLAVRILTIHKSKGLEFDTVVILGVENEAFWGKPEEERCVFFVGMSRAERRLILTTSETRQTPPSNPYRWSESRSSHEEFVGYAEASA